MPFSLCFLFAFMCVYVVLSIFIVEIDDDNGKIGHASLQGMNRDKQREKKTSAAAAAAATSDLTSALHLHDLTIFTDNS